MSSQCDSSTLWYRADRMGAEIAHTMCKAPVVSGICNKSATRCLHCRSQEISWAPLATYRTDMICKTGPTMSGRQRKVEEQTKSCHHGKWTQARQGAATNNRSIKNGTRLTGMM